MPKPTKGCSAREEEEEPYYSTFHREKLCNLSHIIIFIQHHKFEALVMLCKVR
jgi:hypothetical protein